MAVFFVRSQPLSEGVALIRLEGDLGVDGFDALGDEFSRVLDSGAVRVVLDIAELNGISSAGLGAIVNFSQILGSRAGKLILAAPTANVIGMLELLGVEAVLPKAESLVVAQKMITALTG